MPVEYHQIAALGAIVEPFSSLSHLLAATVFAGLTFRLLRLARNRDRVRGTAIFAASVVLLLVASGVYHLLPHDGGSRWLLQRIDHAAIFVLIAGTYTPICVYLLSRRLGAGLLIGIWSVAIVGVISKLFFFELIPDEFSTAAYLIAGWLGLLAAIDLWRSRPDFSLRLLLGGGVAYTAGILTEVLFSPVLVRRVIGGHEIFHVAVILGLSLHWAFISGALRVRMPVLERVVPA